MEKLNEYEAIQRTNDKEYIQTTLNTSMWISRGALKPNGQKALIKRLECFYSSVTVEGKGKKKVYILEGEKEKPTKIKHGYVGTVTSDYDLLIDAYIMQEVINFIKTTDSKRLTRKQLHSLCNFPSFKYNQNNINTFIQRLDIDENTSMSIVRFMEYKFEDRKEQVIKNFLGRVNKTDTLHLKTLYFAYDSTNTQKEIDYKTYKALFEIVNTVLKGKLNFGLSRNRFFELLYTDCERNKQEIELINTTKTMMILTTGYHSPFKNFEFTITNEQAQQIEHDEMLDAYYQRMIDLAHLKDQDYLNDNNSFKAFYYPALLCLYGKNEEYINFFEVYQHTERYQNYLVSYENQLIFDSVLDDLF